MRQSNTRVGFHERAQDNAREGERERRTTREGIRDRAGETYCTGIPKALDTSIAMHYVMVAQQSFYVILSGFHESLRPSPHLHESVCALAPPTDSSRLFFL